MIEQRRLLPTIRWDEILTEDKTELLPRKQIATYASKLQQATNAVFSEYMESPEHAIPDVDPVAIAHAAEYNLKKRGQALLRGVALVEDGLAQIPSPTMVPSTMLIGDEVPGIRDPYLDQPHPSQELFAYNRLGKMSMFNPEFAAHCVQALQFAYKRGEVVAKQQCTDAKIISDCGESDEWALVSVKTKIADIAHDGRTAQVVSRATGVIDLTSPELRPRHTELIEELQDPDVPREVLMSRKLALLDLLYVNDGRGHSPIFPVIQSTYITQHLHGQ